MLYSCIYIIIQYILYIITLGVLKTVPKYITAVVVKDYLEDNLPPADPHSETSIMTRSAIKSVIAATAGAALTNPLDVLRNEMFKTDLSVTHAYKKLMKEEGWMFMTRYIYIVYNIYIVIYNYIYNIT